MLLERQTEWARFDELVTSVAQILVLRYRAAFSEAAGQDAETNVDIQLPRSAELDFPSFPTPKAPRDSSLQATLQQHRQLLNERYTAAVAVVHADAAA